MNKINTLLLVLILVCSSCKKDDEYIQQDTLGYNMLLMGNSFFRPYANRIGELAIDAGYMNHNDMVVFKGGVSGRPINLWNDTGETNIRIKETLDRGDIDVFGMTAGNLPDNPTDGFRDWIAYALQNNPNITIFLSIPPPDFPNDWEQTAQEFGFSTIQETYEHFVNHIINKTVIDSLRAEFPSTNIFSIPTGKASIDLWQMNQDDLLLDDITFMGPFATSLFTDVKGHQGEIIAYTGALMWLNAIYKVDLKTNGFDKDFNTDLHKVADNAMNIHDPNYNQ